MARSWKALMLALVCVILVHGAALADEATDVIGTTDPPEALGIDPQANPQTSVLSCWDADGANASHPHQV